MSGGSYNYAFSKLEDLAFEIQRSSYQSPLRKAFCSLLIKCSKAAYEIEWADSGDTSHGCEREVTAIKACFTTAEEAVREACIESLKAEMQKIEEAIKLLEENE